MKISVVYWSGTGNTEKMAAAVCDGAKKGGAETELMTVSEATADVLNSDVILFGCPAMGAEELEEGEFEPFFSGIEGKLGGKKVGLFGSYGWGDGEWMRNWEDRVKSAGATFISDGVIVNNEPDEVALSECEELGEKAAK